MARFRRIARFRLSTMLVVVGVLCVLLGYDAYQTQRERRQLRG